MPNPPKPLEVRVKEGNPGKRPLPRLVAVGPAPVRVPAAPSSLKQSGKRTWKQMWENGRAWLGPSDEIVVRLACEQVDELVSLRRSAAQLKHPELRLRYLRAVQESEKALLQTVSALGFTPTARAKLGLVVAQAAETQTRLERFTGGPGRPPSP